MKKLLILVAFLTFATAQAAPGDTTWVQTFSFDEPRQASWTWKHGTFDFNIDTTLSYEKVLMYYKIKCDPAQSPACGEWDFLVHTLLNETIGVDTANNPIYRRWELGKYITPYGNGLSLGEGWTFIYDVSDFAPLLRDSVYLQDMNFQEMIDIKFAFIEGTPVRNLVKTIQIWQRDVYLSSYNDIIRDTTIQLPANVEQVKLRSTVTGHGFDNPSNCAEFCPKTHAVHANGTPIKSWQIIEGCANNPMYPQGGTWVYDRAGWCPGTPGTTIETDLTPYIQNQSINFKYDVENPGEDGYYNMHIELVLYEGINQTVDATVQDVFAPTNDPLHSRRNPTCLNPTVVIKNIGSDNLQSVNIKFGIRNGSGNDFTEQIFAWEGNLGFMERDTVELPVPNWTVITEEEGRFFVELVQPNGAEDPTPYNNRVETTFEMPAKYNWDTFQVYLKTNHRSFETEWDITGQWGVVASQASSELTVNTIYTTPVVLTPGCYKLQIRDSGHDGLRFWANMPPYGSGTSGIFILNQYAPEHNATQPYITFNPDFGAEATEFFAVETFVGIEENSSLHFDAYPNPASDFIKVESSSFAGEAITIKVYDMYGKMVWSQSSINETSVTISVKNLPNGLYIVECTDNQSLKARKKIAIQR